MSKSAKATIFLRGTSNSLSITRDYPGGKLRDAFPDLYQWMESGASHSTYRAHTSAEDEECLIIRNSVSHVHVCLED